MATTRPVKGLHSDHSPQDQPENTYRFALNSVVEDGEQIFIGNENSNEPCVSFPANFIPIGKVYIGNGKTAVFLVREDETLSQIGIVDDECNYTTHVNTDLGFRIDHQIDATYRLRGGCEQVVYFTDNLNKPRIYNFAKPEDFKDAISGAWSPDKFNLFKTYNKIPEFEDIEIEKNGQLPAGSYNFAIQYLDENFNPTEFITASDTIIIFHDDIVSKPYPEIRGSTNAVTSYQNFGVTNKSIKLMLTNLDESFPFYRVAIMEANNGSGNISRVVYSEEISTGISVYNYDGQNAFIEGTIEEVQQFNNIIETSKHIEQLENRLVLAGNKGKQVNFCRLQKYASRITADLKFKTVTLNNIDLESNPKRGTKHFEDVGYMPGEIYPFSIVYVFDDGQISPAFHIPGKHPDYPSQMSDDNELSDTFYTDATNCPNEEYWAMDSQGEQITGKNVRHHRFPLRSEVNKPLFNKTEGAGGEVTVNINGLLVDVSGTIDPEVYPHPTVLFRVNYQVDGESYSNVKMITVADYDSLLGVQDLVITTSSGTISSTTFEEYDEASGTFTTPYSGLTYTANIEITDSITTSQDDSVYTAEIFGIEFGNIDIPDPQDLNGEVIVGYYIVRAERNELNKTVLDTGVLLPLIEETGSTTGNVNFLAHGHIMPNTDRVPDDVFALIHPEHRFNNREYTHTAEYYQEGVFTLDTKNIASETVEDVQPGTSYNAEEHKKRDKDTSGFRLKTVIRNNNLEYSTSLSEFANDSSLVQTFYLNALFSKSITDIGSERKEVYNLSTDNKIGIVQTNEARDLSSGLPYVVMKRTLANPYGNFRAIPYYKETDNMFPFLTPTSNTATIFNGDSYISSMKYVSSMLYDIRLASRDRKSGFLNFVIGVLSSVAGIVLTATGVGTAAGIALIGFGVSQIATGIKKDQISKVFKDLYEQGLKETVDDDDTAANFSKNPDDDTIQYFHDIATNLWFESSVNMNWRSGATVGITDFLDSPAGYNEKQFLQYCIEKVTTPDSTNDDGRTYQGYTKAEIYDLNNDYQRREREKIFYHLSLAYDCCSECVENFPYRVQWSEQSFQEELIDNYRVFLPNNYRDIEGETGKITNLFRIQNNLYIQTEEALWHLPQNIQERVTDDVVSFIGTGNFFSIPPRKILDDATGHSAGCQHKWSVLKTPHGVFFVSEKQRVIYQFNGQSLNPISSVNYNNWFKENIPVKLDRDYYIDNQKKYPYKDNPSNIFGSGFITTYDSNKERIIFTKRDPVFGGNVSSSDDYETCISGGQIVVFDNFNDIILNKEAQGWTYVGMENCRMKFKKLSTTTKEVEIEEVIPNDTDIHVFLDTSGSFGPSTSACLLQIRNAVEQWVTGFQTDNPLWTGDIYFHEDDSERWVRYAETLATDVYGGNTSEVNILVISFCNEAFNAYHGFEIQSSIEDPTQIFENDYLNFINTTHPAYKSFRGIHYPIVFNEEAQLCTVSGGGNLPHSRNFLQHSIAALYGVPLTGTDIVEQLPSKNPGFTVNEWTTMVNNLQTANPYPDDGLKNYGWVGKWDRYAPPSGDIINPIQFGNDINHLLEGSATSIVTVVVSSELIYSYVDGTTITNPEIKNNSWTISYSLKYKEWRSLHSYMPNFYIHIPDKHYSWIYGNNTLWKHNRIGHYQNFYGKRYPFIVEFVSLANPLTTKIWDYLRIMTEAKEYDSGTQEFVDKRFITFNKILLYNSRQISGVLNLVVKDEDADTDYLLDQVRDLTGDTIIIDRNERDWTLNNMRDMRVSYTESLFDSNYENLQSQYYIDKRVNPGVVSFTKDWTELESFRDKYLIIRLIFDKFDDIKLLLNYSVENEIQSAR